MDEKKNNQQPEAAETEEQVQTPPEAEQEPAEDLTAQLQAEHENYLRLAAEYDNFRKRTQRERESLYTDIKAETIGKFLPVFDNLQRAMAQETADEAYKKGVEMTMNGLTSIFESFGVETYGVVGDVFDPNFHNAVMHKEDEAFGEGVICEVFQTGVRMGEKVIRHAMVVVAN